MSRYMPVAWLSCEEHFCSRYSLEEAIKKHFPDLLVQAEKFERGDGQPGHLALGFSPVDLGSLAQSALEWESGCEFFLPERSILLVRNKKLVPPILLEACHGNDIAVIWQHEYGFERVVSISARSEPLYMEGEVEVSVLA